MNRGRFALWLAAVAAAACAGPAAGQAGPGTPSLSIERVESPRLLGAFDLANAPAIADPASDPADANRHYRLDPPPGGATGKRARLSVSIGKSTLFAIAGKANRSRARPAPELSTGIAPRQSGGSKSYGAGIERRLGAFEVGAVYQYSKIAAEQADVANASRLGGGEKSHNVRATARIRFRP